MIRVIYIFVTILLLVACQQPSSHDPQKMQSFVSFYLEKYPQATLQDIYKGHFQDKFGPAHLLTNREMVKSYILEEIQQADSLAGDYYIPCGWKGQFYQVNLSVIHDGKISIDTFVDAFMGSANGIDTTLTPQWIEEWEEIQKAVRKVAPQLNGYEEDSIRLAHLLEEGKYVVHHSRLFNQTYQPHYRIIRKDIFDKEILPLLE